MLCRTYVCRTLTQIACSMTLQTVANSNKVTSNVILAQHDYWYCILLIPT